MSTTGWAGKRRQADGIELRQNSSNDGNRSNSIELLGMTTTTETGSEYEPHGGSSASTKRQNGRSVFPTESDVHGQPTGRLLLGKKLDSTDRGSRSSSGRNRTCKDEHVDCRAADADDTTYLTQYRIDHEGQAHGLCRKVVVDECLPCCGTSRRREGLHWTVMWWTWSIIRSELFLYTLHMTSIVLGAIKEVLGLRQSDPGLALIHSSVETAATLLLIVIRMANAYAGYRAVRNAVRHEHDFDPDEDVHIWLIFRWMLVFEAAGLLLFAFSIGCFFVFLYYVHLGWTILSNNLAMITILVLTTLYTARIITTVTRIREDQHKVVIYEAAFIIESGQQPTSDAKVQSAVVGETTPNHRGAGDDNRGVIFVRAVRLTELFSQPHYISILPKQEANVV